MFGYWFVNCINCLPSTTKCFFCHVTNSRDHGTVGFCCLVLANCSGSCAHTLREAFNLKQTEKVLTVFINWITCLWLASAGPLTRLSFDCHSWRSCSIFWAWDGWTVSVFWFFSASLSCWLTTWRTEFPRTSLPGRRLFLSSDTCTFSTRRECTSSSRR